MLIAITLPLIFVLGCVPEPGKIIHYEMIDNVLKITFDNHVNDVTVDGSPATGSDTSWKWNATGLPIESEGKYEIAWINDDDSDGSRSITVINKRAKNGSVGNELFGTWALNKSTTISPTGEQTATFESLYITFNADYTSKVTLDGKTNKNGNWSVSIKNILTIEKIESEGGFTISGVYTYTLSGDELTLVGVNEEKDITTTLELKKMK